MILRHVFDPIDNTRLAHLCGAFDEHLRAIEAALAVRISRREGAFQVEGGRPHAARALALLEMLYLRAARPIPAETLQLALVEACSTLTLAAPEAQSLPPGADGIVLHTRRSDLRGRTRNQVQYLHQILSHDITFGIGPAGTGKTYLAVAVGVTMFISGAVERIVLSRPAVEAGERLGFLPGDMKEKVDPYMQPLYDALNDFFPGREVQKMIEERQIEIAPLAFMRGRTLSNAFVVLDEAQNATAMQMKMFLTRLGEGSRMAVTGDVTQIDLPRGVASGLVEAERILRGVEGVGFARFTAEDVVRHPLVARIITAYEAAGHAEA